MIFVWQCGRRVAIVDSGGRRRRGCPLVAIVPLAVAGALLLPAIGAASRTAVEQAGVAGQPGLYRGRTSQGSPLTLRLTRDGRWGTFLTSMRLYCTSDHDYVANRPFLLPRRARVSGGRFSIVARENGTTYKLAGRFSGARAQGTLSMYSSRLVLGGVEVCVTLGKPKWTATLRG
jgi:hypothetical protein